MNKFTIAVMVLKCNFEW